MPYNLYITRPNGTTYKTLRSPYPAREGTASTVRTILLMKAYPVELADHLAEAVAAAPLGETVTHQDTPLIFRTEEELIMRYRLIVTRPDGSEFQDNTEPLTSRKLISYEALRNVGVFPLEASGDDEEFRRQVESAPLGVAVPHASGFRFTVKEF